MKCGKRDQCQGTESCGWEMVKGCRKAKHWSPTGVVGDSGKGGVEGCAGGLGFRQNWSRVRAKMGGGWP